MFSTKIYILSVFVLCLFNLGQAAPVVDEISSLSTRELTTTLDARGFFDFLRLGKKLDKDTQKIVDTISIEAECRLYKIHSRTRRAYEASEKLMAKKEAEDTSTKKEKKDVKKAYKKRVDEFKELAEKAGKKADEHKKNLAKLGVKDITQCPHFKSSSDSHSETNSTITASTES